MHHCHPFLSSSPPTSCGCGQSLLNVYALHMLACANCLQAMVYDVWEFQAGSTMHANTPMPQHVQTVCKIVQTAYQGWSKLPARAHSNCLQGLVQSACKRCSICLQGLVPFCEAFSQSVCKGLSAIILFRRAVSCADMLLWPL